MVFIACTHCPGALQTGSFVVLKNSMNTKQVVAIIGSSGNVGSALARSLSKGNYRILLRSSKTQAVQSLLDEINNNYFPADAEIVNDDIELCWEADIIILAVPYAAEKQVADNIKSVVNQKVVISVSNPINETCDGLLTPPGTSAAEELQKQLPNAKVVKAFNTVPASDFHKHFVADEKPDCFIAGDDGEATELVYDLVKAAGFNPIPAGDLSMSRTLESMQLLMAGLRRQNKNTGIAELKIVYR
jgi:8-hydroxy-5-deazaflavin:NADPH oxidoreductase